MRLHGYFTLALLAAGAGLAAGCRNLSAPGRPSTAEPPLATKPSPSSYPPSYPRYLPDVAVRLPADIGATTCLAVAKALEERGDLRGAAAQYAQALRLEPGNHDAAHRLAVTYDRLGDFNRAEALYRQVARARPQDADVHSNWGYSHYLRGNWEESARHSMQALELNPRHRSARSNYAMALGRMGRYEEARLTFKEARLSPSELACSMAYLHWSAGNLDRAREELLAAGDQRDERASKMLEQLETSLALNQRMHGPRMMAAQPIEGPGRVETVVMPPPRVQTGPNVLPMPLQQPTQATQPTQPVKALPEIRMPPPEKQVVPTSLPTPSTSFKPEAPAVEKKAVPTSVPTSPTGPAQSKGAPAGRSIAALAAQTPPPTDLAWPRTGHSLPESSTAGTK